MEYPILEEMSLGGIYTIHNMMNQKFYIGSAANFFERWTVHKSNLKNNKHHSQYLQNAWNKYGEDAFVFLPLQCISDKTRRLEMEQYLLDSLKPQYNIAKKATSCEGTIRSEETRKKMRESFTPERRIAISERSKQPKSEDHKKNISEAHKGKKASEETKAKLREIWAIRKAKAKSNEK
jgi:group I intron endonuclease